MVARDILEELGLPAPQQMQNAENNMQNMQAPMQENQIQEPNWLQKAGNAMAPVKDFIEDYSGLPGLGAGFLQGFGNTGISIANVAPKLIGSDARIPHLDLMQYVKPNLMNEAMGKGGDIAGTLLSGAGVYGKLGGILPRASGGAGLLQDALSGALAGYLTGEDAEGDRGLSTVLGGILGPVGKSKGTIANTIKEDVKGAKNQANQLYKSVLKVGESEGLNKFLNIPKVSSKSSKEALKAMGEKNIQAYKEALKSPTLSNVHKAQSDMGKYISQQIKSLQRGNNINQNSFDLAQKLEKSLEKTLEKSLAKSQNNLSAGYAKAQDFYKSNVLPYTRNPAITEHMRGESTAKDFLKRLGGDNKSARLFREQLNNKYPEIGINDLLNKGAKKGALGGAGLGASYFGLPALRDYLDMGGSSGGHE